jgi:hypothetical protein
MPVVLRIPRIVEELETPQEIHRQPAVLPQRAEFRWRAGIGVGVLMLMAAIPWLIRWRPAADGPLEASAPAVTMETDSDFETLPPLYAQTASSRTVFVPNLKAESDSGSELLESLTVPHPAGVRQ